MNKPDRTLLLSVHPRFAKKIFAGSKTVELRRVKPRVEVGDVVAMYVTSPTKAIQGFSRIQQVSQKPPIELWNEVRGEAGINRSEFDAYFKDTSQAVGIHLGKSCRLIRSIKLGDIRDAWDDFHPPQSFRYLSPSQLETILSVQNRDTKKITGSPVIPIS